MTKEIVREQNLTTLMITHSMSQALAMGDRTIMMHQGQIIADLSGAERRRGERKTCSTASLPSVSRKC